MADAGALPRDGRILITDPSFATRPDRHARSLELIKIFDEIFATKDLAEWRKILDGNGLVFGVVGILDDIPTTSRCSRTKCWCRSRTTPC